MSRNNWEAGDKLRRSHMNAPFFMQSGTVTTNDLNVRFGPGRIVFPHSPTPHYRDGTQAVTVSNVVVNTNYAFFINNQGVISVSGNDFTLPDRPDAPGPNQQYLGTVRTGALVTTTLLEGPWTTPSGIYEGRGEYVAVDQVVSRVRAGQRIHTGTAGSALPNLRTTSIQLAIVEVLGTSMPSDTSPMVSGVGQPMGSASVVRGTVSWTPSGALQPGFTASGVLVMGMMLGVRRDGAFDYVTEDQRTFLFPQRADFSTCPIITTSFAYQTPVFSANTTSDYALVYALHPETTNDASATARIRSVSLIVEPGKKTSKN